MKNYALFPSENNKNDYYIGPKKSKILENRILNLKTSKEIGKIRSVSFIHNFKAHEQRACLLFLFPILLNGILPKIYLNHFCLLSESTYILLQRTINTTELKKCEEMLNKFVQEFEVLYGKENVTMNVHWLLHTVYIVKALGPLWSYSTFCFESYNGVLKRYVKGTRNVLSQITKKYILNQSLPKQNDLLNGIQTVGGGKSIVIDDCHKNAFRNFPFNANVFIYDSIKIKSMQCTSIRYKNTNNIDYFLVFDDDIIGKSIYYFEYQKAIYLLIEIYDISGTKLHFKEIEASHCYAIKPADDIKDKLIYVWYKMGMKTKREFVTGWPNKYEKS